MPRKVLAVPLAVLAMAVLSCTQAAITPTLTPSPLPPTQTHTPAPTSTPVEASANVAKIVQATVNLRDKPNGAAIGALKAGDAVTVLQCSDGWCQIRTNVLSGWVWQGCLSVNPDKLGCEAK